MQHLDGLPQMNLSEQELIYAPRRNSPVIDTAIATRVLHTQNQFVFCE